MMLPLGHLSSGLFVIGLTERWVVTGSRSDHKLLQENGLRRYASCSFLFSVYGVHFDYASDKLVTFALKIY
jgi:hypothetical protein